jgi:hypothetical protein
MMTREYAKIRGYAVLAYTVVIVMMLFWNVPLMETSKRR